MLLSTVSLDASPAQDLQADPAQAGPGSQATTGADSFASRLAQALDGLPQGQNLAADGTALTRMPLGPSLEVITTGAAQPDAEALAAFATAQGLDPGVVAWLFGDGAKAGASAQPGEDEEGQAGGALEAALQAGMLLPPGLLIPLPTQAQAQAGAAGAGETEGGAGAGLSPALLGAALMPAAGWLGQHAQGLAGDPKAAQLAMATVPDAAGSFAAAQAMASAGLAAQVVGKQNTDTKVDIGTKAFGVPVQVLSLEVDPFTLALLEDADQPVGEPQPRAADAASANGQPLVAGAGQAAGAGAAASASADPAGESAKAGAAQHRAEALHTLAQRLGEAVGQRVLGQIASGNWSMKLMLKPATLGDVEVDLRMRSGELDAAFRAMNPMTRELLNEGLGRLREVLTSAGMDIAGLHVGHGSSQSAGGNPTPRQPMAGDSQAHAEGAVRGADAAAPAEAVAVRRTSSANWDVLV